MRTLIGLAVGSGFEGVDVAVIQAEGIGLDLNPTPRASMRVAFPPSVRDSMREIPHGSPDSLTSTVIRNIAETAVHATRQVLTRAGISPRDTFALGLLKPARGNAETDHFWPEIADRLAEQMGLTVLHGFRHRDRAAGGNGHPITAIADYLLFASPTHPRLLIHLGSVAFLMALDAGAKLAAVRGFDAGPGNQLLDALVYHGTRGRELTDPGGKKAVQGRCLEPLLEQWREHPHLTRTPPKAIHPEAFGKSFLLAAFESVRQQGAGLSDLLCTATHLIARAVGDGVRQWLPASEEPRQIFVSGGGVRNGFLWQLVAQQFGAEMVKRSDEAGVPALARNAAAAAILTALTCDGVAGNLSALTGAAGSRLLGHFTPGDGRNWSRMAAWLADQTVEYPRINRAA